MNIALQPDTPDLFRQQDVSTWTHSSNALTSWTRTSNGGTMKPHELGKDRAADVYASYLPGFWHRALGRLGLFRSKSKKAPKAPNLLVGKLLADFNTRLPDLYEVHNMDFIAAPKALFIHSRRSQSTRTGYVRRPRRLLTARN
jgi:hypothetical protein